MAGAGPFTPFSDEQLFAATSGGAYPDLFFRARTALEAVSVDHGSMARAASEGTLATQSRALPQYTRSDNVLALFPALRAHLEERHGPLLPGDANAGLPGQE